MHCAPWASVFPSAQWARVLSRLVSSLSADTGFPRAAPAGLCSTSNPKGVPGACVLPRPLIQHLFHACCIPRCPGKCHVPQACPPSFSGMLSLPTPAYTSSPPLCPHSLVSYLWLFSPSSPFSSPPPTPSPPCLKPSMAPYCPQSGWTLRGRPGRPCLVGSFSALLRPHPCSAPARRNPGGSPALPLASSPLGLCHALPAAWDTLSSSVTRSSYPSSRVRVTDWDTFPTAGPWNPAPALPQPLQIRSASPSVRVTSTRKPAPTSQSGQG